MKIYTKLTFTWNGKQYVPVDECAYEYAGPLDECCGATAAQNQVQQQQSQFYSTMTQQAQSVFGSDSTVFNDLVSTFAPTVAAGPDQEGFSAAEKADLNSQAITNGGTAYRNARQAVGEAQAATNGGNVGDTSAGSTTATDINLANSAAENTANSLNQINLADYQTGRENYDTAVQGLDNATGAFNSATNTANAATTSGEADANTANQIATQDNSWVQAVTGALGAVGGAVATGGMSNLAKGVGFLGQNAPAPGS